MSPDLERIKELAKQGGFMLFNPAEMNLALAALAQKDAEIEKLKADAASSDVAMEAQFRKFEECPHTVAFNKDGSSLCGCSFDRPGDVCAHHAPALREARLRIERLEGCLREALGEVAITHRRWCQIIDHSMSTCNCEYAQRLEIVSRCRGALDGNGPRV